MRKANAADLDFIKDNSIDFICTHPPYADIIKYRQDIEGDISLLTYEDFLKEMTPVAQESYRVLKKGKRCVVMIGDMRKRGKVVPLGFRVMDRFLQAGFAIEESFYKVLGKTE